MSGYCFILVLLTIIIVSVVNQPEAQNPQLQQQQQQLDDDGYAIGPSPSEYYSQPSASTHDFYRQQTPSKDGPDGYEGSYPQLSVQQSQSQYSQQPQQ